MLIESSDYKESYEDKNLIKENTILRQKID